MRLEVLAIGEIHAFEVVEIRHDVHAVLVDYAHLVVDLGGDAAFGRVASKVEGGAVTLVLILHEECDLIDRTDGVDDVLFEGACEIRVLLDRRSKREVPLDIDGVEERPSNADQQEDAERDDEGLCVGAQRKRICRRAGGGPGQCDAVVRAGTS
jgi:hypothetical protein